jgi:hypothetical protein
MFWLLLLYRGKLVGKAVLRISIEPHALSLQSCSPVNPIDPIPWVPLVWAFLHYHDAEHYVAVS